MFINGPNAASAAPHQDVASKMPYPKIMTVEVVYWSNNVDEQMQNILLDQRRKKNILKKELNNKTRKEAGDVSLGGCVLSAHVNDELTWLLRDGCSSSQQKCSWEQVAILWWHPPRLKTGCEEIQSFCSRSISLEGVFLVQWSGQSALLLNPPPLLSNARSKWLGLILFSAKLGWVPFSPAGGSVSRSPPFCATVTCLRSGQRRKLTLTEIPVSSAYSR